MAGKSKRGRRVSAVETRPVKKNLLKTLGVTELDYKDTGRLRLFISERGKIRPRRVTGLTVQQQRQASMAIKNAREMALLPYPSSAMR
jgi:small subunit ribosomal protein S18